MVDFSIPFLSNECQCGQEFPGLCPFHGRLPGMPRGNSSSFLDFCFSFIICYFSLAFGRRLVARKIFPLPEVLSEQWVQLIAAKEKYVFMVLLVSYYFRDLSWVSRKLRFNLLTVSSCQTSGRWAMEGHWPVAIPGSIRQYCVGQCPNGPLSL